MTTLGGSASASPALGPDSFARPRMRGLLHAYALGVAAVSGIVLCSLAAARPGWAPLLSYALYSGTVCALFGVSALYHRRVWNPRRYLLMKRLDHSMIFVFIAGTYTPLCVMLLDEPVGRGLLAVVWSGALVGVLLKTCWPGTPRSLGVVLYLALGWIGLTLLPGVLERGGVAILAFLVVGGAIYTAGALCYAFKSPNPWPQTFGYHELFHAATLAAATCHQVAIYLALFV